jgi:hypothetical protein
MRGGHQPLSGWLEVPVGGYSHEKLHHCYHNQPRREGWYRDITKLQHSGSIAPLDLQVFPHDKGRRLITIRPKYICI